VTNLFQFLDATMTDGVGSPAITLQESAGWGVVTRDISAYANKPAVQFRWGFVSDGSGQFAGVAIDDLTVTACCDAASCNDDNPCTDDVCDAVNGCLHVDNDANGCSDGNSCTTPDVCLGGTCVPGPNPCDDQNACTVDVCDGLGGCTHAPLGCDDVNPCTDDSCVPASGCAHADNALPCSDGIVCTVGDRCVGGACLAGAPPAAIPFCNTNAISVPSVGAAPPYPSSVSVATGPIVCSLTVSLNGVTHGFPDDIDVLLSAPDGKNAIVLSDVGGGTPGPSGVNLTLDDAAASPLPDAGPLLSGTFKPTNVGTGDTFAAPAPGPLGGSALSVFDATNPNGTWSLWVMDDAFGNLGSLSSWCLNVSALCVANADCNDGNVCTDDSCDTVTGACVHTDNSAACDDANACTDDQCSPQSGACLHVNNASACEDGNPCTAGDHCGGGACQPGAPITAPPEVGGLAAAADKATFTWSGALSANQYDVLRGSTAALPVGPGGGDEVCFADRVGTTIVDATIPLVGNAFWYVVRGENACGPGTYGTRSTGTPRTTTTCP